MSSARKALKRKRRARASAISIQVHFLIGKPPGIELTPEFLREVFEKWIIDGSEPTNIRVVFIEWTNHHSGKREYPHLDDIEEARLRLRSVMLASRKTIKHGLRNHLHLHALVK